MTELILNFTAVIAFTACCAITGAAIGVCIGMVMEKLGL